MQQMQDQIKESELRKQMVDQLIMNGYFKQLPNGQFEPVDSWEQHQEIKKAIAENQAAALLHKEQMIQSTNFNEVDPERRRASMQLEEQSQMLDSGEAQVNRSQGNNADHDNDF